MTRYHYDAIGRLTKACPAIPCGSSPQDFSYAYDPAGNITSKTAGATTTAYDYSDANELTCAYVGTSCDQASSKTTYAYELGGKPAITAYTWYKIDPITGEDELAREQARASFRFAHPRGDDGSVLVAVSGE